MVLVSHERITNANHMNHQLLNATLSAWKRKGSFVVFAPKWNLSVAIAPMKVYGAWPNANSFKYVSTVKYSDGHAGQTSWRDELIHAQKLLQII